MYNFVLENAKGDRLNFNQLGGAFTITAIEGLNPPNATINTSEMALIDGAKFNSAKAEMRVLRVAFAIEVAAAENRLAVYRVLKPKQPVRAYYTSDTRDVYIDGYVQSVDVAHFDMKQVATVSILCPAPYFRAAQEVVNEMSQTVNQFHFPFSSPETPEILFGYVDSTISVEVANGGDVATGVIFELYAYAPITNPKIFDYVTKEYLGLNVAMQAGDLITVDTRQGHKTVTLLRNGAETNIFNSLMKGSSWLQLDFGSSIYTYEVATGSAASLNIQIRHFDAFEGV